MTNRCAVWGSPIAHSLSPVLHRAAYAELGLPDWDYGAVEVDEASLPGALAALDDTWRGLSLTMPLKRAVLAHLDSVSPVAEAAGAVNTVLFGPEGRTGDNTDVLGMVAAVREVARSPVRRAIVVGGGATAASTLLALADLGCAQAVLVVRDPRRAEETLAVAARRGAPQVSVVPLDRAEELREVPADLLVGTVPAAAWTPELLAATAQVPVVFEMVYDGWPTPLAAAARTSDDRTLISPMDLLVHQALLQVVLMTGRSPETVAAALPGVRAAGDRALAARVAGR